MVGTRIRRSVRNLENQFMGVVVLTYRKVKENGYDVGRFRARLHSCTLQVKDEHRPFFQRLDQEIDHDVTIEILWEKLCNYWNFLNYTLLENLTRRISDDTLTKEMEDYVEMIKTFRSNTRVVDFLKYCPVVEERLREVDLKGTAERYELDWETCTLDDFSNLRRSLMHQLMLPALFGLPMPG